jgi:hypothetical protein
MNVIHLQRCNFVCMLALSLPGGNSASYVNCIYNGVHSFHNTLDVCSIIHVSSS